MTITSKLYLINLGEKLREEEVLRLLPMIPPEKQQRLKAFRNWEDAQRSLLGYSMVGYLLSTELKIDREMIKYVFNEYGKPFLSDNLIYFNLSHSGDWIVCGISKSVIGVDVEQVKEIDLDIAERFFAPIEVDDLFSQPTDKRYDYFYKLWTLKESYIKAEGKGLSIPLNSFWFRFDKDEIIFYSSDKDDWHYRTYEFDSAYKLSVCVKGNDLPESVQLLTLEDLL